MIEIVVRVMTPVLIVGFVLHRGFYMRQVWHSASTDRDGLHRAVGRDDRDWLLGGGDCTFCRQSFWALGHCRGRRGLPEAVWGYVPGVSAARTVLSLILLEGW